MAAILGGLFFAEPERVQRTTQINVRLTYEEESMIAAAAADGC